MIVIGPYIKVRHIEVEEACHVNSKNEIKYARYDMNTGAEHERIIKKVKMKPFINNCLEDDELFFSSEYSPVGYTDWFLNKGGKKYNIFIDDGDIIKLDSNEIITKLSEENLQNFITEYKDVLEKLRNEYEVDIMNGLTTA